MSRQERGITNRSTRVFTRLLARAAGVATVSLGLVFLLVVVAGIVVFLFFRHQSQVISVRDLPSNVGNIFTNTFDPPDKRSGYPLNPKQKSGLLQAAAWYRPFLLFDTGEPLRPLRIDDWLSREHGHRVCLDRCRRITSEGSLFDSRVAHRGLRDRRKTDLRLDIEGRHANDYRPPEGLQCGSLASRFECDGAPRSAIYVTITHQPEKGLYLFDYWWFLRFNDYRLPTGCRLKAVCVDHEGDWEGATVVVNSEGRLLEAHISQHEGSIRRTRDELAGDGALAEGRYGDTTREQPIVYVARGTHAGYTRPCPIDTGSQAIPCLQERGLPESVHDGTSGWYFNDDARCAERCVLLLDEQPWVKWPGRWGREEPGLGKGPESPGLQPRYERPGGRAGGLLRAAR